MNDFDKKISVARPETSPRDETFTIRVMNSLPRDIFSPAVRTTNVKHKETFRMKLRHLPIPALVALIVAAVALTTGTAYAVVKAIESSRSHVQIEKSGINTHGREQLTVAFDNCAQQKAGSTTYELKKDSGLSAEDGANALEAACELNIVDNWLTKDSATKPFIGPVSYGSSSSLWAFRTFNGTSTISAINSDSLITKASTGDTKTFSFPSDARVVANGKVIDKATLKVGDTIKYFSPGMVNPANSAIGSPVVVFKLTQPTKYYSMNDKLNSYEPCSENSPARCLTSNGHNQVYLKMTNGGTQPSQGTTDALRHIQGKVVSFDTTQIMLDNNGTMYTINTPSNIIATYNQTTVYGLASFDSVYAKTDPEALKVAVGDSLDIYYLEPGTESSRTINWSKTITVNLMVERNPSNMDILRKY